MGHRRAVAGLPEPIRPQLVRTLDYPLLDNYLIWPDELEAGLKTACRPMLDDHRAYRMRNKSTAICQAAADFFDPWQKVYARLKAQAWMSDHETTPQPIVQKCSNMFDPLPGLEPNANRINISFYQEVLASAPCCTHQSRHTVRSATTRETLCLHACTTTWAHTHMAHTHIHIC